MNKWFFLMVVLVACTQNEESKKIIDIQGHRGARGLAPENSIPGFLLAAEMGVSTLELDLVVSKDSQLIVSHEPFFSPEFFLNNIGKAIPEDSIINMYQLTYDEISQFDCGSIGNPRFPDQKNMNVSKPLFSDVIDQVENFIKENGRDSIRYNIELKTTKETDSTFHPAPDQFSELVYALIKEKGIIDRSTIQSFDFRTIQYFNEWHPDVTLVLLIENDLDWKANIDSLGFSPEVYSPYYKLLSQEKVKELQGAYMKVIPWTVNETADIKEVLSWDVDGIISDYPDRVLEVINNNEQ